MIWIILICCYCAMTGFVFGRIFDTAYSFWAHVLDFFIAVAWPIIIPIAYFLPDNETDYD